MSIQLNVASKRKRKRKVGTSAFALAGAFSVAEDGQAKEKIIKLDEPVLAESAPTSQSKPDSTQPGTADGAGEPPPAEKPKVMSQVLQSLMAKSKKKQQYGNDKSRFMAEILECPTELDADDEDVFDDMPVEDFGRAMLRGMGWAPEANRTERSYDIKVRPDRLGLGATPLEKITEKKDPAVAPPSAKSTIAGPSSKPLAAPLKAPSPSAQNEIGWLLQGIRVRINSDQILSGKYYAQKAVVQKVSGRSCTVKMDSNGKMIGKMDEKFLNSALPKRGGTVVVLKGKHRGRMGQLTLRDKRQKLAHVQFMDGSRKQRKFRYDDVAEYVQEDQ